MQNFRALGAPPPDPQTAPPIANFWLRACVHANSIRTSVFFVVRTKAHPQILRTHRVEHGSTFVRFRTYQ